MQVLLNNLDISTEYIDVLRNKTQVQYLYLLTIISISSIRNLDAFYSWPIFKIINN